MSTDRWMVTLFGLALVGLVAWFFWLKKSKGAAAVTTSSGAQEAMILVKGGYTPDVIVVQHGKPVRLMFRREETSTCSDTVVFADFNKSVKLPTGETVAVELLPEKPGTYDFGCMMGMFRGKLVVE
ncbi:MAG TPA: cupredoxin domain-containing protein [Novimethylophilus sp.]|jgi:plastocyanin domain-containing protein|uniref:cupredoxin domain-containing protein n=1 Tax=Novimethylophilus sp. TaxID=2137426 RepID=UPI002F3F8081